MCLALDFAIVISQYHVSLSCVSVPVLQFVYVLPHFSCVALLLSLSYFRCDYFYELVFQFTSYLVDHSLVFVHFVGMFELLYGLLVVFFVTGFLVLDLFFEVFTPAPHSAVGLNLSFAGVFFVVYDLACVYVFFLFRIFSPYY